MTLTFLDMNGKSQALTATIPAGTHRGEMIAATVVSSDSHGKKILTAGPSSAGNLYDVLLGRGNLATLLFARTHHGGHHWKNTPDRDARDGPQGSHIGFTGGLLGSFLISQRLEYGYVVRFLYNLFDPKAIDTECVGRPFSGIDELTELIISAGDQVANAEWGPHNGRRVLVIDCWRGKNRGGHLIAKTSITECPAYEICRAKEAGRANCRELPANEWKRHVRIVLEN